METQAPAHMRNGSSVHHAAFVVLTMALLVLPLMGMPFASEEATSEKRDLAQAPQPTKEDGSPNLDFMSDAGAYFLDHFAFRSALVDADATIRQHVFGTSSTENVVVGTSGWLYYAGTLDDYQRKDSLSDRALENAAYNLKLIQSYLDAQGKRFVVAIAPNKNSLYPQNMPYYQLPGEGPSNFERLAQKMAAYGVHYVNLHEAFGASDVVLYFQRDSHWNDQGALLAYERIMVALGRQAVPFIDDPLSTDGHVGDVDAMLHPSSAQPETQMRHASVDNYAIVNDATSVEDSYLVTKSGREGASGTLLMYRDSFGNNLLKPFATTYAQSVFTKLVPYDMGTRMIAFAQDVVVERTERHLPFFATNPPYLPASECVGNEGKDDLMEVGASVFTSQNGTYLMVDGSLDAEPNAGQGNVYVEVTSADGQAKTYQAFRVSTFLQQTADFEETSNEDGGHIVGDLGYRVFIPNEDGAFSESSRVRVLTS